jgi:hypothetical protein
MFLTPDQALNQLIEQSSFGHPTLELAQLIALGSERRIKAFIKKTRPDDLKRILNDYLPQFGYIDCLHMLLYWHTGENIRFFRRLYKEQKIRVLQKTEINIMKATQNHVFISINP